MTVRMIPFHRFSKARVWHDEDPFDGRAREGSVSVEVFVPRGAMSEYGLLGGNVLVGSAGDATVACSAIGAAWAASLASGVDDVRVGLPEEYHSEIVRRAAGRMAQHSPTGRIVFDQAAFGEVGSSGACFGALSEAVVELLFRRPSHGSDGLIVELLNSLFHPRV